jgi:tetratricopeptide (TPR) repeat protein
MEESRSRQGKTSGTRRNPIRVPETVSVRHAGEGYIARVTFDELMSRGVYLFYRQQENDAVEYLRLALTQQPSDLRARYLIALAAQLHSDEETIEQMAQTAREIDPQNAYALACEGVRFMDLANFARADQYFEHALLKIPSDVDLWFGRGMLYDYSGEHERAIGAYLHVVQLDAANVAGRIALGNAYADTGEYQAAFSEYERARRLDPHTDNPHLRLGKDLFFARRLKEAAAEFEQATLEEPERCPAWFFLLAVHRQTDSSDEALDVYHEIRRRFNGHPELTAELFEQTGAWQDAVREYRRLLETSPEDPDLHASLAVCYRELGAWENVVEECRAGIVLEPENSHICRELGNALFRLGRYESAIRECRKAVELDRYDFGAYTIIADCLVLLGRTEMATSILQQQERLQQEAWTDYQNKYYGGSAPARPRV